MSRVTTLPTDRETYYALQTNWNEGAVAIKCQCGGHVVGLFCLVVYFSFIHLFIHSFIHSSHLEEWTTSAASSS